MLRFMLLLLLCFVLLVIIIVNVLCYCNNHVATHANEKHNLHALSLSRESGVSV